MEIQIGNVNFQPTKTGKNKWVIATSDGNLSVWDEEMAEQLNKIIGQSVKVDIRPAAPDTNYLPTITKVDFDSAEKGKDLDAIYDAKQGNAHTNGTYQKSVAEEKFRTPKEMVATELVKAVIGQSHENVVLIDKAVGMYKEALELLG